MDKMSKNINGFFVCLLIFLVVSCTTNHPTDTSVADVDFLDISVQSTDPEIGTKDIDLYVVNKTNDCVIFPYNYGLEIYFRVNGNWVKVNNLVEYFNTENRLLTSSSGIEPDGIIFIHPDYSSITDQPTNAKIILSAYLCNNGKPSSTLSKDYIEISLE
jgi:hypothetical protein